jgi:hypothetical protein
MPSFQGCLDVAHMSRADTNMFLDEYDQQVDEIIAACPGDLRGAVKALMLINEQLEQTLQRLSAGRIGKAEKDRRQHLLH